MVAVKVSQARKPPGVLTEEALEAGAVEKLRVELVQEPLDRLLPVWPRRHERPHFIGPEREEVAPWLSGGIEGVFLLCPKRCRFRVILAPCAPPHALSGAFALQMQWTRTAGWIRKYRGAM